MEIRVPDWIERICVWPVMWYRKRKYGYDFRRIYLGEGEWTIVEPQDYYWLSDFKWSIIGNGRKVYAIRNIIVGPKKTKILNLHREIMKAPAGLMVDHRNNNSLDNRRANLRLATRAQNVQNSQKRNIKTTSRFIGVHLDKESGRWATKIAYQGKVLWLGRFKDEVEAAKAYDAAAKKYRGEFAKLNFPESADSV
jgi:hypothetical protein